MNLDHVEKIAEAVLYEGYMLYPYRRSAIKNQQRWSFGILYPPAYEEVQSGTLMNGANVVTAISIPQGSAKTIGFACDNGLQKLPPAQLRVAVWDGGWEVHNPVVVDSSKGQTVITFGKPKSTSAISVQRLDTGDVNVGYQVS